MLKGDSMKAYDLRTLRKTAGFETQTALAKHLGARWNQHVVCAIETGLIGIDDETYCAVRAAIEGKSAETKPASARTVRKAAAV